MGLLALEQISSSVPAIHYKPQLKAVGGFPLLSGSFWALANNVAEANFLVLLKFKNYYLIQIKRSNIVFPKGIFYSLSLFGRKYLLKKKN